MQTRLVVLRLIVVLVFAIAGSTSFAAVGDISIEVPSDTSCNFTVGTPLNFSNPWNCPAADPKIEIIPHPDNSGSPATIDIASSSDANQDVLRFKNARITAKKALSGFKLTFKREHSEGPNTTDGRVGFKHYFKGKLTADVGKTVKVSAKVTNGATTRVVNGTVTASPGTFTKASTLWEWTPPPDLTGVRILEVTLEFNLNANGYLDIDNNSWVKLQDEGIPDKDKGGKGGKGGSGGKGGKGMTKGMGDGLMKEEKR